MGLCFYNIAFVFLFDKIYPEEVDFTGIVEIASIVQEKEYTNKYVVKVKNIENLNDYKYKSRIYKNTKLIIYCDKNISLYPGDVIRIDGEFNKANTNRNYKGFNYRKYLKKSKIYGIVQVDKVEKLGTNININSVVQNLRLKISSKIKEIYQDENSDLLNSILIGKSDELDDDVKENFNNSSISHILAISGLHVSYVVICINFLFSFIVKNKKIREIIIIIFLFFYMALTGGAVSCIRACIMQIIVLVASILHRKNNFYRSLIIAFICVIFINPFNIYSIGMWFSFLGTLGIVLFYNFFLKLIEKYLKKIKFQKLYLYLRKFKFENLWLCLKNFNFKSLYSKKFESENLYLKKSKSENLCSKKPESESLYLKKFDFRNIFLYFFKIILITISAQILIIPIMIYEFNLISLTFIISNFLISFLIGPILFFGYLSVILALMNIPIYKLFLFLENILLFSIVKISQIFGDNKFVIYLKTPSIIFVFLYYIAIIFCVICFKNRKYYYLKCVLSIKYLKRHLVQNKKYIKIISAVLIVTLVFQNFILIDSKLEIHFLDVGQGDCTFIKTPKGKSILIDGGEGGEDVKFDYGKNVVLPYLLDNGVNKIDYVIISHFDSDHVGRNFVYFR